MKIFEIYWDNDGERSWIAAETNIHALQLYCSVTGMDLVEFNDTDIITELPRDKWPEYNITDEYGLPLKTFEQYMMVTQEPGIIAESHYGFDEDKAEDEISLKSKK